MLKSRVYVVEDHPTVREHMVRALDRLDNLTVCGSSDSAEEARQTLPEAQPDLVVVDVSLPKMNGLEFAAEMKQRHPSMSFVLLSGHRLPAYSARAKELGLQGYVVKGNLNELETAVTEVLSGKSYFPELGTAYGM